MCFTEPELIPAAKRQRFEPASDNYSREKGAKDKATDRQLYHKSKTEKRAMLWGSTKKKEPDAVVVRSHPVCAAV